MSFESSEENGNSTQYVSFGRAVKAQQHWQEHRKSNHDHYLNPSTQHLRNRLLFEESSVSEPLHKTELSLFPVFDRFLLYTPTYIIKNRSKTIYVPALLAVAVVFVLRIVNHTLCYLSVRAYFGQSRDDQVFVILMFALPCIGNIVRLNFFVRNFDFKIWHYPSYINPRSGIATINDTILQRLSLLLRRPAFARKHIGKSFRIGWFLIMLTVLAMLGLRIIFHVRSSKHVYFVQSIDHNSSSTQTTLGFCYAIACSLLSMFVFDIPDLLCLLTARIHFMECVLHIQYFTDELSNISLDEIIESNVFEKYHAMRKQIENCLAPFEYFLSIISFEIFIGVWYGLNRLFVMQEWQHMHELTLWILCGCLLSTFIVGIQFMFALRPAIKMNAEIETLCGQINGKIDDILLNRQTFHQRHMLMDFIETVHMAQRLKHKNNDPDRLYAANNAMKKHMDKSQEVQYKINSYSIQKSALDVLQQLLYEMEQHSCSYKLFGMKIESKSLTNLAVALVATQIFSLLWLSA